jgi:hypothetical protein
MREESVNFDTTENLIIEGDNLEVLELLQNAYLGQVRMIYIDPPYNTGNDFIYPDNYAESLQTYLEYTRALRLSEIRDRCPERCDPGRRTQEHRDHGRPLPRPLQQPAIRALRLRREAREPAPPVRDQHHASDPGDQHRRVPQELHRHRRRAEEQRHLQGERSAEAPATSGFASAQ